MYMTMITINQTLCVCASQEEAGLSQKRNKIIRQETYVRRYVAAILSGMYRNTRPNRNHVQALFFDARTPKASDGMHLAFGI